MSDRHSVDPTSWQIRDWKEIAWETVHADGLLCPTPAFVFGLLITSDGSGEADALVYDGTSGLATGKHISLFCGDEEMIPLNWFPPLFFHQGIYVDIGTNVDCVLVQYLPWR